jgi:PAS domain S-box-containing protein
MFGYDRSELIGQSVDILLPERLREIHIKHRAGYMADPRTRPMGLGLDLVARHKDGSEFPVVIGLNATETKDGTLIISSITNISDDRKPEPAADK